MPTRYILLGAACLETPSVCLLDYEAGRPVIRIYPDEIEHPNPAIGYEAIMLAPGDGRVTLSSLSGRRPLADPQNLPKPFAAWQILVCGEHARLPSAPGIIAEILVRLAEN